MIKTLLLYVTIAASAPAGAAPLVPSEIQFRDLFGWYAGGSTAAPRTFLLGVEGFGEIRYAAQSGRPWIVMEPWRVLTIGRPARGFFKRQLTTRRGVAEFTRLPGRKTVEMIFDHTLYRRQPRTFESALTFPRDALGVGRGETRAARDEVTAMIAHLAERQALATNVTPETLARARGMVDRAARREAARWSLERRFGTSDTHEIYLRFKGMISLDVWGDVRTFEPPNLPWRRAERDEQIELSKVLRAFTHPERIETRSTAATAARCPTRLDHGAI